MSRTCADYSPEEKLMFAKQGEASARAWLEEEKEEVYKLKDELYMLYTSLEESLRLENSETRDRINNRFQNKMKKLRKMA